MKITKQRLKQIIREELENVLEEQLSADDFRSEYGFDRDDDHAGDSSPESDDDYPRHLASGTPHLTGKSRARPMEPPNDAAAQAWERAHQDRAKKRSRPALDPFRRTYDLEGYPSRSDPNTDPDIAALDRRDYAEKMATKKASAPFERVADTIANLTGANKRRFIPDADLPDSAVPQNAKRKSAREKALKK